MRSQTSRFRLDYLLSYPTSRIRLAKLKKVKKVVKLSPPRSFKLLTIRYFKKNSSVSKCCFDASLWSYRVRFLILYIGHFWFLCRLPLTTRFQISVPRSSFLVPGSRFPVSVFNILWFCLFWMYRSGICSSGLKMTGLSLLKTGKRVNEETRGGMQARGNRKRQKKKKKKKKEYHRELEIKLLVTELGFKLSFIPIFHFPFPRARSRWVTSYIANAPTITKFLAFQDLINL